MRKLSLFAALCAVTMLSGCNWLFPENTTDPKNNRYVDIVQNVAAPGHSYNYQQAFAAALGCDASTLTWSVQEPGDHAAATCLDGCVSSVGMFTAPSCGSAFVGATVHVQAFCPATGQTGTAAIAVSQELLQALQIYAAIVNPGTSQACLSPGSMTGPFPLNVTVPLAGQAQFYAQFIFTCHNVVSPTLPSPLPGTCGACGKLTCP